MEDEEKKLLRKMWDKARELRDALIREGDTYAILILKRSFVPTVDEIEAALENVQSPKLQLPKEDDDGDHDTGQTQDQGFPPPPERGPAP